MTFYVCFSFCFQLIYSNKETRRLLCRENTSTKAKKTNFSSYIKVIICKGAPVMSHNTSLYLKRLLLRWAASWVSSYRCFFFSSSNVFVRYLLDLLKDFLRFKLLQDSVASNWVLGLLVESSHCYLYCLSYLCAIRVQKSFKVKALFKATKDCCRFANNDSNVRKKNINNLQIVTIYRQKYVVSHSCQNWLCVVFILSKDIRKTELNCPITLCLGLSKPRWRYAEEASDSARGRKSNKSHD